MVWDFTKYNTLQPFEETRQKLLKPSCYNFSLDLMFYYLIFHLPNVLIALINCSDSRWTSHKVDLLTITPRKTSAENSWIIILQNNYKCLLLNDKKMLHEILLSLFDEMQNTKKMKTWELKERTFKSEVREIGWMVLIFI